MLILLALMILAIPMVMTMRIQRELAVGTVRPVDLGVAFIWIVFLYAFLPVIGISLASFGVGTLTDQRLGAEVPDPELVTSVATKYAVFMLAFSIAYFKSRTLRQTRAILPRPPTDADLRFVIFVTIGVKAGGYLMTLFLGADTAGDYISSYLTFRDHPLLIQQAASFLANLDFAVTVFLIVAAVAHSQSARSIAAVLVLAQVAISVLGGGSRSFAFLCAFALVVAMSFYDSRLRLSRLAVYAVLGVVAFLAAGILRASVADGEGFVALRLVQDGEFLSVFYNSLDLLERLGDPGLVPLQERIYLVDFFRLIPQQVVGSLKIDPATYYVNTFYPGYSEAGGGLAFGAIAEASVGFGWPDALVRGGLLGWLYAFIANQCLRGKFSFPRLFVYVWFVVISYQAVRDTTFSVLPRFLIQVVPLLVLARASGAFLTRRLGHGISHATPPRPAP